MTDTSNSEDLAAIGAQLRELGHDLRGLLGVPRLEAFSLVQAGVDVREATDAGDAASVGRALAELEEIAVSLRDAARRGTELADEIHRLGVTLQEGGNDGEPLK